jgi:DNA end-binding protein Ku
MPRAIWTGSVTFGLVNVPIRLVTAVREHKLQFHLIHEPDAGHIGYAKVCKLDGEAVPDEEIVKAYESDGELVYLTDEDFEAAQAERRRTIDVSDFVPLDEIDPIYFARTYYALPQEGSEKVYALFVRALEQSELVGIGTLVMRDREHLVALRIRDSVIAVEQMRFADEIVPADGMKSDGARVQKKELDMALQLVEQFTSSFEPERYKDTYRNALMKVIKKKREGKDVHVAPPEEEEAEAPDLMAALRQSVEEAKSRRRKPSERKPSRQSKSGRRRSSRARKS